MEALSRDSLTRLLPPLLIAGAGAAAADAARLAVLLFTLLGQLILNGMETNQMAETFVLPLSYSHSRKRGSQVTETTRTKDPRLLVKIEWYCKMLIC